jgi:hypothetical protein
VLTLKRTLIVAARLASSVPIMVGNLIHREPVHVSHSEKNKTLMIRSTRKQGANWDPLMSVFIYPFNQCSIFFFCPSARVDVGVQIIDPSITTLCICSTWNHQSNWGPLMSMSSSSVHLPLLSIDGAMWARASHL